MPAITILIAPIRLRSIYTNYTYIPMINRPSNRRALCLTTITTAAGTILPPKSTLAAPPAVPPLTPTTPPAAITIYEVDNYLGTTPKGRLF
jgi:hypothetical protein